MNIMWPTAKVRSIIDEIRGVIGRDITIFVTVSGTSCPVCTLDPVTNTSTDSFCVTCGGNYWIATTSAWACSAHIRWRSAEQPNWQPGGIVDMGDCTITIANSGTALYNVQNSDYFLVDDKEFYMKNYRLKGVQEISRITVTLMESPDV